MLLKRSKGIMEINRLKWTKQIMAYCFSTLTV